MYSEVDYRAVDEAYRKFMEEHREVAKVLFPVRFGDLSIDLEKEVNK